MKIRPVRAEFFHADEAVTFRSFANAPKSVAHVKSRHSVHEESLTIRVFNAPRNARCYSNNRGVASQACIKVMKYVVNEAFAPALNTSSVAMTTTTRLHCLLKWHVYCAHVTGVFSVL